MADLTVVRTRSLDRVRVRPVAADAGRGRRRADVRRLRRFTGRGRFGSCCRRRAGRRLTTWSGRSRPARSRTVPDVRTSDNACYGYRRPNRSGAGPPARSAPDSLTFSRPRGTIAAREAPPTFARGRPDMQDCRRKRTAECMFMHRLQSERKAIRTSAARAPEPDGSRRGARARGSRQAPERNARPARNG